MAIKSEKKSAKRSVLMLAQDFLKRARKVLNRVREELEQNLVTTNRKVRVDNKISSRDGFDEEISLPDIQYIDLEKSILDSLKDDEVRDFYTYRLDLISLCEEHKKHIESNQFILKDIKEKIDKRKKEKSEDYKLNEKEEEKKIDSFINMNEVNIEKLQQVIDALAKSKKDGNYYDRSELEFQINAIGKWEQSALKAQDTFLGDYFVELRSDDFEAIHGNAIKLERIASEMIAAYERAIRNIKVLEIEIMKEKGDDYFYAPAKTIINAYVEELNKMRKNRDYAQAIIEEYDEYENSSEENNEVLSRPVEPLQIIDSSTKDKLEEILKEYDKEDIGFIIEQNVIDAGVIMYNNNVYEKSLYRDLVTAMSNVIYYKKRNVVSEKVQDKNEKACRGLIKDYAIAKSILKRLKFDDKRCYDVKYLNICVNSYDKAIDMLKASETNDPIRNIDVKQELLNDLRHTLKDTVEQKELVIAYAADLFDTRRKLFNTQKNVADNKQQKGVRFGSDEIRYFRNAEGIYTKYPIIVEADKEYKNEYKNDKNFENNLFKDVRKNTIMNRAAFSSQGNYLSDIGIESYEGGKNQRYLSLCEAFKTLDDDDKEKVLKLLCGDIEDADYYNAEDNLLKSDRFSSPISCQKNVRRGIRMH